MGKAQLSWCIAEGLGADVIPAWIGEGILTVQHSGDPQPIAPPAEEIGGGVLPAAGGNLGLVREEVGPLATAEPVRAYPRAQCPPQALWRRWCLRSATSG